MQTEPKLIINDRGTKNWFSNDIRHREDGPAVELTSGTKRWYSNGELHRTDGPAVERSNGDKYWFLNGKPHREDGPAVERSNGDKYWFLNGIEYDFNEWLKLTSLSNKEKVKLRLKYVQS